MQDWTLTVDRILDHAARWHPRREVVTRTMTGQIVRTDYLTLHSRSHRLSDLLGSWGVGVGDRVATLAWNTDKHMEVWYATMGIGAVCHTLNPRLHPEQLIWIINHAGDRVLFLDDTFLPTLSAIVPACRTLERLVVLSGEAVSDVGSVLAYEALLNRPAAQTSWGGFFDTGDIARIDADGFMQISDRGKDIIKSGGEWISSIEIETRIMHDSRVEIAAVIGAPHPRWDERPLLFVKLKPDHSAAEEELLSLLNGQIPRWWMPDEVRIVDEIPIGATGKVDKKTLRTRYAE